MDPLLYTLLPFYYFFHILFFPLQMMALAQIQQLMNSLVALQNTVHQQSAIIQQLQNQTPPPATGSTPRGPKMAMPPLYDGSMASCEAFINACQLYISAKPHEFATLQVKIMWILGFTVCSVTPSSLQRSRFNP
ncbi:hypothetical protein AMATHDRAFT_10740 [Amanita thiersii Skay4041]|uniref:Uncharacterized protein n=1 Tax=Amanita thiersii Skay4041 TaxID=703135 RepID=A0A2A9NAM7_9AGAR|nr:hypothetical protein AMATHDRAFT_10740 [Amanita thiersii Skay4041]